MKPHNMAQDDVEVPHDLVQECKKPVLFVSNIKELPDKIVHLTAIQEVCLATLRKIKQRADIAKKRKEQDQHNSRRREKRAKESESERQNLLKKRRKKEDERRRVELYEIPLGAKTFSPRDVEHTCSHTRMVRNVKVIQDRYVLQDTPSVSLNENSIVIYNNSNDELERGSISLAAERRALKLRIRPSTSHQQKRPADTSPKRRLRSERKLQHALTPSLKFFSWCVA